MTLRVFEGLLSQYGLNGKDWHKPKSYNHLTSDFTMLNNFSKNVFVVKFREKDGSAEIRCHCNNMLSPDDVAVLVFRPPEVFPVSRRA